MATAAMTVVESCGEVFQSWVTIATAVKPGVRLSVRTP